MSETSRLKIGDLVRDYFGCLYIVTTVFEEPNKPRFLSMGTPWRYEAYSVTQPPRQKPKTLFKETALILVRKK